MRASTAVKHTLAVGCIALLTAAIGAHVEVMAFPPLARTSYARVNPNTAFTDIVIMGVKNRSCTFLRAIADDYQTPLRKVDGSLLTTDTRGEAGAPFIVVARIPSDKVKGQLALEVKCHPLWTLTQPILQVGIE